MAATRKVVLVLGGLAVGAALGWLLGNRDDEAGWFESEGVVRAGPEVDAPEDADLPPAAA